MALCSALMGALLPQVKFLNTNQESMLDTDTQDKKF